MEDQQTYLSTEEGSVLGTFFTFSLERSRVLLAGAMCNVHVHTRSVPDHLSHHNPPMYENLSCEIYLACYRLPFLHP